MTDSTQGFFDSPKDCSLVKAQIVFKYVQSWARVLSDYLRSQGKKAEVAYGDLFSGPGLYSDGTPSTPMLILKAAAEDPKLRTSLRTYFNDLDHDNTDQLREAIGDLPTAASLSFAPVLSSASANLGLIADLQIPRGIPALFFLDQFGYKHVTLELIDQLMRRPWTECVLFFNYRRIIAALENSAMQENIENVFGGKTNVSQLRDAVKMEKTATGRERAVLRVFSDILHKMGIKHVLHFSFKGEDTHRSTHHLIFLSQHDKGYQIMKSIMAKEGSPTPSGIPGMSFIQNPSAENLGLFATDLIHELSQEILEVFAGQTLSLETVFLRDSPGKPYLLTHYRRAAILLEAAGKIRATPPAAERPMVKAERSMAPATKLYFKRGSE